MTASTPPWPRLRNVGSVQLMTQLGTELGLTVPQCLAQTGLDVMALADGQAQVQAAQELQVVSNLLAGLPEQPLLGLLAGRRYQLSRYGIWGYALLCSASLGEALDMGLRYLDLTFAFCRIHARKDASGHWLVVDDSWVEPSVRRFLLLRDSSAIARIHRELTGLRQPFKSVQLALPAPPAEQLAAYTEAYGCTPSSMPKSTCWSWTRNCWPGHCPATTPPCVRPASCNAISCCNAIGRAMDWLDGCVSCCWRVARRCRTCRLLRPGCI
ncbi:AraC family transcriptional regulator [Halopseudomonas pachastrellae]|nr:AraC family transcriptional regulator [Halopseudomonas pachastrellae]